MGKEGVWLIKQEKIMGLFSDVQSAERNSNHGK